MDVGPYTLLWEEDLYGPLEETLRVQNGDFDQDMGPISEVPLLATGGPSQFILQHIDAEGQRSAAWQQRNKVLIDAYISERIAGGLQAQLPHSLPQHAVHHFPSSYQARSGASQLVSDDTLKALWDCVDSGEEPMGQEPPSARKGGAVPFPVQEKATAPPPPAASSGPTDQKDHSQDAYPNATALEATSASE